VLFDAAVVLAEALDDGIGDRFAQRIPPSGG